MNETRMRQSAKPGTNCMFCCVIAIALNSSPILVGLLQSVRRTNAASIVFACSGLALRFSI